MAYVQLGCPSLFMTFLVADFHWRSLMRHVPNYQQWEQANDRERVREARIALRDDPHIAA